MSNFFDTPDTTYLEGDEWAEVRRRRQVQATRDAERSREPTALEQIEMGVMPDTRDHEARS